MFRFRSIRSEMSFLVGISMLFILLAVAWFYVDKVSDDSEQQIRNGILHSLSMQVAHSENFLKEKGEVVETMLSSPQLIDWFSSYRQREKDLSADTTYPQIIQWFKNLQKRDPNTKAVFFASAFTGEYFDDVNERYSGDGTYYATKRPWWGEAVARDKLFVTQPEVDYVDKTVVSSVKRTVYNQQRELIGIAGVDILLSTIQQQIGEKLKYQGQGEAFLINHEGNTILFPAKEEQLPANSNVSEVDSRIEGAAGFAAALRQMQQQKQGFTHLSWKGKPHLIAYQQFELAKPEINWIAAIMVPESMVDAAINKAMTDALISVLVILLTLMLVVVIFSARVTQPLRLVVAAIHDVAHGEADLTQRLNDASENETGALARQFNLFIERIHQIIARNKATMNELVANTDEVARITESTAARAQKQSAETRKVVAEAAHLNESVARVSERSDTASSNARRAISEVETGLGVVNEAVINMRTLADSVNHSHQVIEKLSGESQKIGAVLEVIQSIAEQTNLLALNAAIEAARAGDQGRGFAVVADEVRSLASRTQESTASIDAIIQELQNSAKEAVTAMDKGSAQAQQSVDKSSQVESVLSKIASEIQNIQRQSSEIASETTEQVEAARAINQLASLIQKLAEETHADILEIKTGTEKQKEGMHRLSELTSEFKT